MIEVNHLVKKYGNHFAVEDLSFYVEKGQIYGFLGPNGAGKSTTMNIITGYLAPTSGEVKIDGHDITKEPEEARMQIGYLPEIPPVYLDMTVKEYLLFAAQLKRVPRKERKAAVEEAMQMTHITDMQNRLIRNLSKGYRQRVGLSQALLGHPEVIILDEPTVGLDPKQIIEIRDLIKSLREEHTVILSSHILSEVSAICDQILIISKGKLVACNTPEGLADDMRGETELHLSVKAGREQLEACLKQVEGITDITIEENGSLLNAVLRSSADVDVREQLVFLLADARIPVMEMIVHSKSLEDIFLELTASDEKLELTEEQNMEEKA